MRQSDGRVQAQKPPADPARPGQRWGPSLSSSSPNPEAACCPITVPPLAPCYRESQVLGPELVLRSSGSTFAKVKVRGGQTGRMASGEDCIGCFVMIIAV